MTPTVTSVTTPRTIPPAVPTATITHPPSPPPPPQAHTKKPWRAPTSATTSSSLLQTPAPFHHQHPTATTPTRSPPSISNPNHLSNSYPLSIPPPPPPSTAWPSPSTTSILRAPPGPHSNHAIRAREPSIQCARHARGCAGTSPLLVV